MTEQEQEELRTVLSDLLKEYRRIRVAYLTGIASMVEPPRWEVEKRVRLFFGEAEEKLERQKNMF